jgi:hypothetical protein
MMIDGSRGTMMEMIMRITLDDLPVTKMKGTGSLFVS